jgi:serine/threonine protein kinase/tetratricopeptide (TPR) repeat protein
MASKEVFSARFFRFDEEFDLDLGACELRRAGQPVRLGRIPMELLLLLVEQRGQLVTREQIIERVWGKDVFLDTDNSINAAIRKIRQVLEDNPEQPRFVQTVIGRGYRFISAVAETGLARNSQTVSQAQGTHGLIGKKVSHYRVLRLLGGGGMGLVYMAEDLKLGRRVAIKFLPEELADNPSALNRLQREARAASALDHPNICSIYHLDEHEGQPFIVMQLLEGETLREWIGAASTLSSSQRTNQLVDLAIQIADGLQAAHRKDTIHRDIKPANIFITSQGQAKILDFGVAKLLAGDVSDPASSEQPIRDLRTAATIDATNSEALAGTPSYLSPEQVRCQPLDARSDLFSFGLVLYEMATGHQAFSGNTVTGIRDSVLQQTVASPRQLNPALPADLEGIINKCLEKDPSARYQSAADVRGDLAALSLSPDFPSPKPTRWAMWVSTGVVLLLIALVGTNVGGIRDLPFHHSAAVEGPKALKVRPSVAVLGFKNLSGKDDEAWISTALSEMLDAELASGQKLRLIPGENVARMKLDLALPAAVSYGPDTLRKIHKQLSNDMVVVGSYLAVGQSAAGKVRVNQQLQNAQTGETITAISEDGTEADLAELVSRSGDRVRQVLQIGSVAADDADQVRTTLPRTPQAARLYAQGLAQLRSFENLAARDLFLKAVEADPNHALSHAALSECWATIGYDTKAREEGKKALALSANLSREDQLSVEGRYRLSVREWPRAVEIYKMLWEFYPDNLDYGLNLAKAQAAGDLGKDAIATVERLVKSPLPAGDDPRIDIVEASAADKLGDLRREEKAAARAADKGRRQGARLLTAGALLTRGSALSALGDNRNAVISLKEAQETFSAVGDRQGVARVLIDLAVIERHEANLAEAQKHSEQALEILRQTGSMRGIVQAQTNLGNVLNDRGDVAGALKAYQQSLRSSRELGARRSESIVLNNIAGLLTAQGKLAEAHQSYDESLGLARDMGDLEGIGIALGNIADLLTREGKLAPARKMAEDALATDRRSGVKSLEGYALHQLASILVSQGELDPGRIKFQEAATLRHQLGEKVTEAESQFALGQLLLDTGDPNGAESKARSTAVAFHEGSSADDEALSYSLLALALAARGKSPEALQSAERANELLPKVADLAARLQCEMDNAYVDGVLRSGAASESEDARKIAGAIRALEGAQEKSSRLGYAGLELEASLRLAKLELHSGRASAGRMRLERLQHDSQAKGFLFIAHRASDALRADSSHH